MTGPLVSACRLERIFDLGSERVPAVHNIDMDVLPGWRLVITGCSGSGKTTLLPEEETK